MPQPYDRCVGCGCTPDTNEPKILLEKQLFGCQDQYDRMCRDCMRRQLRWYTNRTPFNEPLEEVTK